MFFIKKKDIDNSEFNGKTRKKLIISLVMIMILLGGISYASFYYDFLGGKNVINVAPVELELLESTSEIINLENALPMSDKEGMEQSETFDFAVTTRTESATNIYYNLKIEKLNVDNGYTSLEDDDIRVYLTDYNDKAIIAPIKISDLNNYTFYKTYNSHSKETGEVTTKYKLRVWVDRDVDISSWNQNTKLQYKFKIGVSSSEYNSSLANLSQKIIPTGAYYISMDSETGDPTIQNEVPETVSENDMYVYGDYLYVYSTEDFGGWAVLLATTESFAMFGLTEVLVDYPVTDKNQISYDPILDKVNGKSITLLYATFNGCTELEEIPTIPKSVMMSASSFIGSPALKSNTNIYSYYVGDIFEATNLDTITNYTTDYKSLNKSFFLKHNIGSSGKIESQEVCYILNENKYCLKGGGVMTNLAEQIAVSPYYEENKSTLLESFGEENCIVESGGAVCSVLGLSAYIYMYPEDADVRVNDASSYCYVFEGGTARCGDW